MYRLVLALVLAVSTSAVAAEKATIAVLDLQGTGVTSDLLPTLTDVLTVEIAEIGLYKVIAGRDIQTMLGFERQKDVLGCTDAACLAEIGGALGVDRIIASHIGMVGSTYVVNIKLINIRSANTEGRAYETVRGEVDALIATVKKSARKLLGPGSKAALALAGTAGPAVAMRASDSDDTTAESSAATPSTGASGNPSAAPSTAAPSTSTKPTAMPAVQTQDENKRSIGIMPWVFWGVGAVGIGAGIVTGINANKEASRANNTQEAGSQVAAVNAPEMAKRANILLGAGAVAVAGGFAWMLLFGNSSAAPPATVLAPVVTRDGVGLVAATRF